MSDRRYMEYEAIRWALEQNERLTACGLGGTDLLVLTVIAAHADKEKHECWLGYDRIAKESSVCRRTAIPAVQNLVREGFLQIVGRHSTGVNRYRLMWDQPGVTGKSVDQECKSCTSTSECKICTSTECKICTSESAKSALLEVQDLHPNQLHEAMPLISTPESKPEALLSHHQVKSESNQTSDSDLMQARESASQRTNGNSNNKDNSKGPASPAGLNGRCDGEGQRQSSSGPPAAKPDDTKGRAPRPAPATPSPVAAALLALPYVGAKLTAKDAESVGAWLREEYGEDKAEMVIGILEDKQLAIISKANNPAGYLRSCLRTEYREANIRGLANVLPLFRSGEYWTLSLPSGAEHPVTRYMVKLVHELWDEEFEISEIQTDEVHCYVEVRARVSM
jgi:hypothetical protein